MTTVTKLDKAKVAIGLDHPFFASILYKRKLVERKDIPTLAVSDRGTIYYNPEFVETLSVPQLVWGLCHEVGHVICQHAIRQGSRDHKKWNYAGDAWINDTLDSCQVGQRIPNTVDMRGSKDKTTEQIYDELPQDPNGGGSGNQYMDGDGMGEDIIQEGQPLSEAEKQEIEAQTKIDIAEAAQIAKAKGKLPGALSDFVADVLTSKIPWYDKLLRYLTDMSGTSYTWARPNRRFLAQRMYLPSTGKEPSMGEMVIQIDVSGSISKTELDHYNGHLQAIIAAVNPAKTHVLYVDTRVVKHEEFEVGQEVQLSFYSGGGTDMEEGFRYIDEVGIDPAVCVVLTDMYTSFTEPPSFPVIWCASSDIEAPYGETIRFELEE